MTSEIYQQAKAVFHELLNLDTDKRTEQLETLEQDSPALAKEVGSLLKYHTTDSFVAPQSPPRVRTRSTLSTSYSPHRWAQSALPLRALAIGVPLTILAMAISLWSAAQVHQQLRQSVQQRLNETIDMRLGQFLQWESDKVNQALQWSQHHEIASAIEDLTEATRGVPNDQLNAKLIELDAAQRIQTTLNSLAGQPVKFAVWDRYMNTLADWNQEKNPAILGRYVTPAGANMLARSLHGRAKMYLPGMGARVTKGYQLQGKSDVLSIFVPVTLGSQGPVSAVLMVRGYNLQEEYESILEEWRSTEGREVYFATGDGTMLTKSRYDPLELNLQTELVGTETTIALRDPGTDLTAGQTPHTAASEWPDTVLARQVKSGISGCHVDKYRNYAGHPVVGAWRWITSHGIAIALEEDYERAFSVDYQVQRGLLAILGSFLFCGLGLLATSTIRWSHRRKFNDASSVGPYHIKELIGEGGMGRVYLAEHALLCRHSAIKVLTKGDSDRSVISRFEREVQLASQLTHPNTTAIYDFGRTNDGVFFYAMEYIEGAHLGQLIDFAGPIEPHRCIYLLQQLCRALQEAHLAGVVHRDIKPQNIMLCNRGGEPDFLKLFDYGLVKAFAPGVSEATAQTRVVVGTPRFMAPERLNSPWLADPRVDVYSVGALAYFLLTGQLPPLVTTDDGLDSTNPSVETLDLPAGVVEFGRLLSVCMAVDPAARPSSMHSLIRELDELAVKFPWSRADSEAWWQENEKKLLDSVREKRKRLKDR